MAKFSAIVQVGAEFSTENPARFLQKFTAKFQGGSGRVCSSHDKFTSSESRNHQDSGTLKLGDSSRQYC